MGEWNFADVWEAVADAHPDETCQVQGERRLTWGETDARADGIARTLLDTGLEQQDKVGQYLFNAPEYLESMFAIFKAGLVPVNTNYRYRADELVYLWDNADARAVVFHGTFTDTIDEIRDRVPGVELWLWVDDGSGPCPDWATPYEDATKASEGRVVAPWGRSGDDLYMLYTGGTTGMPKGVMWRQHDLYTYLKKSRLNGILGVPEDPDTQDLDAVRARCASPGPVCLPACPLMHGTGALTSMSAMRLGGTVVTLTERRYDVVELLDAVDRERVQLMAIVGDPFARPMLDALDAEPERWDISSMILINSSGAMWSDTTKQGLLHHHDGMALSDGFSSSEALGMGRSVSTKDGVVSTGSFQLGERARVITDDDRDVEPGSGEVGMVAVGGPQPIGYYKDPEKSARTFREIDGERYSIPGDHATVTAEGEIQLLGRGNVCINTGGEKVFPEEVEEAIKAHDAVHDAVVVGVPDERFGQAVTGVVSLSGEATEDELIASVKERLASYKAPKRIVVVDDVGRSPSGKADYAAAREVALERLGLAARA